ncbi:MAG TPA: DUF4440 domain-containing protein [Gemmatimonadaceae bacterium]
MSSIEPTNRSAESTATSATTSPAALRQQIDAANARFMDAFQNGDARGIAACYTADAQLLPAHNDVVEGAGAITEFWRRVLGMGIAQARLETTEVEGRGDMAAEIGRYTLIGADGATLDHGKYVVVWHRAGDGWKLHRDIWTTSQPQQTA